MLLKYLYTLEILRIKNQLCFKSSIVASLTKPDSASAKYELCAKKKVQVNGRGYSLKGNRIPWINEVPMPTTVHDVGKLRAS